MSMPGFTAAQSLGAQIERYQQRASRRFLDHNSINAQAACYCSEPDTRTVCRRSGGRTSCREERVCLQYYCPRAGNSGDPRDLL
jgi:hypothetical protein